MQFSLLNNTHPRCTIMNHSCEPNCVWIFNGKAMVVRTVSNISSNDQVKLMTTDAFEVTAFFSKLFISYIAQLDCCRNRRACLRDHYAFECSCVRCTREEGNDEEVEHTMTTIKSSERLYNTQIGNGCYITLS